MKRNSLDKFKKRGKNSGFSLLEVLISILVFSFGLLGLIGMQAVMIKNTTDAQYRATASYVAQQRLGQMWTDQTNLLDYLEDDTDISAILPGGTRSVERPVAGGPFVVTVTWQQPGGDTHTYVTSASIAGG